MTSLTDHADPVDLREVVDVVIGVDTHVHTHTAAVIDARTGGVLDQLTVTADAAGYAELVELAEHHTPLRAWAIEGTGSHGAGLARVLGERHEVVIELDRPVRAKLRNGAKSDPLDAVRAAREALARPRLGTPRASGDRQALSVLLTTRRSAVEAAGDAQRQLFALVIVAPEKIRDRFRGQKLPVMVRTAAALRVHPSHDTETTTTITALRSLARRVQALTASWRPDLLEESGVGPISAAIVLCPPTQPRLAHHRPDPPTPRSAHPRLHRAPYQRRQEPREIRR